MSDQVASSEWVRVGDTVLLCNLSPKGREHASKELYAYSEGFLQHSVLLGDLQADKSLLSNSLFRIELNLSQAGGQLNPADRELEKEANAQKLAHCSDNLRFGMCIRLRHVFSDLCLGLDTVRPAETVGAWDVIVGEDGSNLSTQVVLNSLDKSKFRMGDDIKYEQPFVLTFQADFLNYYTNVKANVVMCSAAKGSWKLVRPMEPPLGSPDLVKLYSYVQICHQELDLALAAVPIDDSGTAHKVALVNDNDQPSTIWLIEPKEFGKSATPVGAVCLKNVVTQHYLTVSEEAVGLSISPSTFVDISAHHKAESDQGAIEYGQTFRIISDSAYMVTVNSSKLKETSLKKLVMFQTMKETKQQVEVLRRPKKKKKEAMFYFDTLDQAESAKLNVVSRMKVLMEKLSGEVKERITTGAVSVETLRILEKFKEGFNRTFVWLQDLILNSSSDAYIRRRLLIVETGLHVTLGETCQRLVTISNMIGREANSDPQIEAYVEQGKREIFEIIDNIAKFLSEIAKGSRQTARRMLEPLKIFNNLTGFESMNIYLFVTAVLSKVSPLADFESLELAQAELNKLTQSLVPFKEVTEKHIYQQAALLFQLKMCCYEDHNFLPWYARSILQLLNRRGLLPLFRLKTRIASSDFFMEIPSFTEEALETFLQENTKLTLDEASLLEGETLISLMSIAELPGYHEYVFNYLMLLSTLAQVWPEASAAAAPEMGVSTEVCVKLSREVALSDFGTCGLKLVAKLILTRNRTPVYPKEYVLNNCYYPSRCKEENAGVTFMASDKAETEVEEVVVWVSQFLFQKAQKYDSATVNKEHAIKYITTLIETIQDLIEFGHTNKFFFHAIDRYYPYLLMGFARQEKGKGTWLSDRLSDIVAQSESGTETELGVSRALVNDCYRGVIHFGMYLIRIKRSFQLESLARSAFKEEVKEWGQEIEFAFDTHLQENLIKCEKIRNQIGLLVSLPNQVAIPRATSMFSELDTAEILNRAPDLRELLYQVVTLRSSLLSWEADQVKLYLECAYGEKEDLLHLLCKSELLEDSNHETLALTLQSILSGGILDAYLTHKRMRGEESEEIVRNCEEALRQLCNLIHPYCSDTKTGDVAAYRNVLRHNQVQAKVYRVWEVAYKQRRKVAISTNAASPISIIEKYCIQFFYNFAFSSSLNQRDLRKFFSKPLFTTQSPQLIDLLEMLERFKTLTINEKLLAVEEVLQNHVKGRRGQQPTALYLVEVLMFDNQGPVKEVQNAVARAIISELNTHFSDLTQENNLVLGSAYLRLISLACEGNVGMTSQAKILFSDKDFFAKVGTCGVKMLRSAWDFIGRIGNEELKQSQSGINKLFAATLSELDARIFSRPEALLQIAYSNSCELLYTDAAVMSIQVMEGADEDTDTLMLLGSRRFARPSGVLPMLKAMSSGKEAYLQGTPLFDFVESLASRLINLQKQLGTAVTQNEDWKNVDMTGFLDVINDFLKFFGFPTETSEESLLKKAGGIVHGAFLVQSALKKRNPMGEIITHIYQSAFGTCSRPVPAYISAILENCKDPDLTTFVSQSRALLRFSDNKHFYFDLMRGLLLSTAPEDLSTLVVYMLESKVALDAVKTMIVPNYVNRLPALQLLITLLSGTSESVRGRFRSILERYSLETEFFDELKENLEDVTVEQIQKYQDGKEDAQNKQSLLRLECALKTLEFMQVLCDMCNLDYQRYLLSMPGEGRSSLLYETLKQLMAINQHRSSLIAVLQPSANTAAYSDYSAERLHEYNAFNQDKALQHLMFVRGRFQLAKVVSPEQPPFLSQMNLLTASIIKTLVEAITGPCVETQTFIGNFSTLHLTFSSILEIAWTKRQEASYRQLYDSCVALLLALLDGEPYNAVLHSLSSYLDFQMLLSHLKDIYLSIQNDPEAELKHTGINIFMVLLKWTYISPYHVEALKDFSLSASDNSYFVYFIKHVGYVEIDTTAQDQNETAIKSIYFPIPEDLKYMTLESKNELLFDVERSNQKDQIHDFLQREEIWRMELAHQKTLESFKPFSTPIQHWRLYGQIAYTILLLNSLFLLFATTGQYTLSGVVIEGKNNWKITMLRLLGGAQLLLSTLHILCYTADFLPNICMKIGYRVDIWALSVEPRRVSKDNRAGLLQIVLLMWKVVLDTYFLYYVLYFGFSCLAMRYPFIYPFLLLDIVTKNSNLVTILQSITTNAWQLFLTFCLALICIYVFSMFGYVFFQSFYQDIPCTTLMDCLVSTFSRGVQNGGGIVDSLAPVTRDDPLFWGRFVFDLAYFIVIVVVLLNVIFGIILDTFGELRDDRNQKSQDIASTCYICGQTRSTLELKASGWKNHFTGEHSPFAYLAFLIYLDDKPEIECNGIEKYVKEKKRRLDHTFVPNTCKKLLEFESSSN